jgi:hypothetical protein
MMPWSNGAGVLLFWLFILLFALLFGFQTGQTHPPTHPVSFVTAARGAEIGATTPLQYSFCGCLCRSCSFDAVMTDVSVVVTTLSYQPFFLLKILAVRNITLSVLFLETLDF